MENHNEDYKKIYAQKAKARAEELLSKKNISVKDYFDAEYCVTEAKNTYPNLEGLTDLLEAIQIHTLYLSKTINGKPDYYKILRADPSMSFQELRAKYKKRSLLVHPDKNKAICATEAFKIVSIAIKFLEDETKRADYNRAYPLFANQQPRHDWLNDLSNLFENDVANNENKMDGSLSQPAAAAPTHSPPPSQYSRGHTDDVPNHNTSSGSTNPGGQPDVPSPSSSHPGTNKDQNNKGRKRKPQVPELLWTKCCTCKYRFAYPSYFLGRELICRICKAVFLAEEIEAPE
ncbi:hypothetical protein ACFE04_007491 [Oxalis oulophora]